MSEFKVSQADLSDVSRKYNSAISKTGMTKTIPLRVNTNLSIARQSSRDISIIKQNISICTGEIDRLYMDLIALRNGIEAVRTESEEADRNAKRVFKTFPFGSFIRRLIDRLKELLDEDNCKPTSSYNVDSKWNEWGMAYKIDDFPTNIIESSKVNRITLDVPMLDSEEYLKWRENPIIPITDIENIHPNEGYTETVNTNSSPLTNSNTHNGYSVLSELKDEYCFNQKDYSKFISPNSGKNVGCTATAVAIAYSILHGTPLNPTDVPWSSNPSSVGVSDWSVHTNVLLAAGSYSASDAMNACYEQISNGVPVILRVKGGHSVTVVGIKDGADPNNLKMGDFLIVDPSGGAIKTLDSESWFGGIDTSWSLRVPK